MKNETKIQTRGICPICGSEQAVDGNGRIAHHGYTVEFGMFLGNCFGSREQHYGSEGSRKVIARYNEMLKQRLESLPDSIDIIRGKIQSTPTDTRANRELRSRLSQEESQMLFEMNNLPKFIVSMTDRMNNQKPLELKVVDLIVLAQEEKARKAAEKAAKDAEKAKAAAEKAERKAAAEEKKAAKMALLLSADVFHQIVFGGVVVVEWQEAYESEYAMWRAQGAKVEEFLKGKLASDEVTKEEMYWGSHGAVVLVKTESGKAGRTLEKSGNIRFINYN